MVDIKNYALNSTENMEEQIKEFANSEAYKNEKIRIMPDGHAGKGCVVGSTMTFSDKIVPNTVGVDVACRVSLYALGINVNDLNDDFFKKFDRMVAKRIPTGFNVRHSEAEESKNFPYENLKCYKSLQNMPRLRRSMGTLGGGNHYLELDVDNDGDVYLSIHCGSRNLGKQVCDYYQSRAIEMKKLRINLRNERKDVLIQECKENGNIEKIQFFIESTKKKNANEPSDELAYIYGTDLENYLNDMHLCNQWSKLNHAVIYREIKEGLGEIINDN